MRRFLTVLLIVTALAVMTGCPNPPNPPVDKVYGYHCFMEASLQEELPTVHLVNTPPISAVYSWHARYSDHLQVCEISDTGVLSPVVAQWTLVDPSAGALTDGGFREKVFAPAKPGLYELKAAVDGTSTVVTIPLHVYNALGLNVNDDWGLLQATDFDSDGTNDISVDPVTGTVSVPGGIIALTRQDEDVPALTQTTQAPTVGYTATSMVRNDVGDADGYVLKTSGGHFVKLRFYAVTYEAGKGYGVKFIYLATDETGTFAY